MFFLLLALALAEPIYTARVERVIDGDTIKVKVAAFPSVSIETSIRVLGVDTPELKGKCESEKQLARAARDYVRQLIPAGSPVILRRVKPDKYAGRHDAEVELADGRSLAALLIAAGYAREYHGERRRGWCGS